MQEIKEHPKHITNVFRLTDKEIALIYSLAFYCSGEGNLTPKASEIVENIKNKFMMDKRIFSFQVWR